MRPEKEKPFSLRTMATDRMPVGCVVWILGAVLALVYVVYRCCGAQ